MKLIEALKNCEGCRRRRKFLKEMLGGIGAAVGLSFLSPPSARSQTNCGCLICDNGVTGCLCCDPFCSGCFIINDDNTSVTLCEVCAGHYRCIGIGCYENGCPPGKICTKYKAETKGKPAFPYYWVLTLSNEGKVWLGADEQDFDAVSWFNRHKFTNNHTGESITAKSSTKLPLPEKA